MDSLRLARVLSVYPGAHKVELEFLHNSQRVGGVPVMCGVASANSGQVDLPMPDTDMIAVVAMARGVPIVLGFLHTRVSQMLFDEPNRKVYRHASDVYVTITDAGDIEVAHPSGTYIRIGESPEHEDLTGKDHDGQWRIAKNTDKAPYVRLGVASGGTVKCALTVAPDGQVTLDAPSLHMTGIITADGDVIAAGVSLKTHVHGSEVGPGTNNTGPPAS